MPVLQLLLFLVGTRLLAKLFVRVLYTHYEIIAITFILHYFFLYLSFRLSLPSDLGDLHIVLIVKWRLLALALEADARWLAFLLHHLFDKIVFEMDMDGLMQFLIILDHYNLLRLPIITTLRLF